MHRYHGHYEYSTDKVIKALRIKTSTNDAFIFWMVGSFLIGKSTYDLTVTYTNKTSHIVPSQISSSDSSFSSGTGLSISLSSDRKSIVFDANGYILNTEGVITIRYVY